MNVLILPIALMTPILGVFGLFFAFSERRQRESKNATTDTQRSDVENRKEEAEEFEALENYEKTIILETLRNVRKNKRPEPYQDFPGIRKPAG